MATEGLPVKLACRVSGRRDLSGCTLYTTVEPCPMCFTTSWLARVSRVVLRYDGEPDGALRWITGQLEDA